MPSPKLPTDLLQILAAMNDVERVSRVLGDLLTPAETTAIGERWNIVKMLAAGHSQRAVRDAVGVSVTTVSRGNRQLQYGSGGFELAFDQLEALGLSDPRVEDRRRAK